MSIATMPEDKYQALKKSIGGYTGWGREIIEQQIAERDYNTELSSNASKTEQLNKQTAELAKQAQEQAAAWAVEREQYTAAIEKSKTELENTKSEIAMLEANNQARKRITDAEGGNSDMVGYVRTQQARSGVMSSPIERKIAQTLQKKTTLGGVYGSDESEFLGVF